MSYPESCHSGTFTVNIMVYFFLVCSVVMSWFESFCVRVLEIAF